MRYVCDNSNIYLLPSLLYPDSMAGHGRYIESLAKKEGHLRDAQAVRVAEIAMPKFRNLQTRFLLTSGRSCGLKFVASKG